MLAGYLVCTIEIARIIVNKGYKSFHDIPNKEKVWYTDYMKNTYKCAECKTSIIINTNVHELPESIICPCESVMPLDSSK